VCLRLARRVDSEGRHFEGPVLIFPERQRRATGVDVLLRALKPSMAGVGVGEAFRLEIGRIANHTRDDVSSAGESNLANQLPEPFLSMWQMYARTGSTGRTGVGLILESLKTVLFNECADARCL
jgi:hypothetical protein